MTRETVIDVRALGRRFGDFDAVRDVTFQVPTGEIFGYLGANGAGKSTTIRMLCGLLAPTAGAATVLGHDVGRDPEAVKRGIGYMSQRFSLYPDLTVAENLDFFGGAYGLAGRTLRDRIDAVMDEVALSAVRDQPTAELPGGIQQRVALANALLHEPRLLFLDEPTAGVDPAARREFLAIVRRRVRTGTTVFLTTHYLDEAEYCRRVGLMVQGRLVALGTPAELKHAHVPGTFWSVTTTRVQEIAQALGGRPDIVTVQPFGPLLRVRAAPDASGVADAVTAIDPRATVEPAEATLEDVFRKLANGGSP